MRTYETQDITPDLLASLKYDDNYTPEEVEAIVALARTMYPAEELQRHLDRDDGIPLEDVLKEIEEELGGFEAGDE